VTGEDQRERALQARAWHKKFLAPERKRLKALRDDPTVANAAEIILAGGKRRADQVAAFPPKKVPFITTETEEADKAIAARPATAPDAQEAEDAREAEEQARVHKEWERISATLPRRVKSG
jgi:hypothetical protein